MLCCCSSGDWSLVTKMEDERRVHPDCINASNPYHECVEYCFRKIAEAKAWMGKKEETGRFCLFTLCCASFRGLVFVSCLGFVVFLLACICLCGWFGSWL